MYITLDFISLILVTITQLDSRMLKICNILFLTTLGGEPTELYTHAINPRVSNKLIRDLPG
jgi:hypothetical protein